MEVNTYLNAVILVLVVTIIAVISTSLVRTEPCVIKITGESITVLASKLGAKTIRAIADLKPLSVERLSFH
uniref:Movement protein TGBp3 n=1 Tax=Potato virus X TaxID=12183 RepID=A0A088D9Y8_PVX|nr:TGB3 [Potato virus X]